MVVVLVYLLLVRSNRDIRQVAFCPVGPTTLHGSRGGAFGMSINNESDIYDQVDSGWRIGRTQQTKQGVKSSRARPSSSTFEQVKTSSQVSPFMSDVVG